MYLLGYDLGSSSVKASILQANNGKCIASAFYPKQEMKMMAAKPGWAEQDPSDWWENAKLATRDVLKMVPDTKNNIAAIGISYQMHGLVMVDKNRDVIRPSIIWCDSRAVKTGEKAFDEIGAEKCLASHLNSPGNFTASKLKWVKDNEPELFERIYKIMLPGDYLAMMLTNEIVTTASGLSEGIFWDFTQNKVSDMIMNHYGFDRDVIPEIVPTFSEQGKLTEKAAHELGLRSGIPVAYRAGDQPNNAFSLNVINPGEVAATAGTSGVVYGVSDETKYDPLSRVNTFAHVNHLMDGNRLGVLLCINGTGIMNSWTRNNMASDLGYEEMNRLAEKIKPGSEGLAVFPFGNGAERMLNNKDIGCQLSGLNFNIHGRDHFMRAEQEGDCAPNYPRGERQHVPEPGFQGITCSTNRSNNTAL